MFWIQKQRRIFCYNMEINQLETLTIYLGKSFEDDKWYFGLPDNEDLLMYYNETPIKKCHIRYFNPKDSSFIIDY